jgi:hypothetical protein
MSEIPYNIETQISSSNESMKDLIEEIKRTLVEEAIFNVKTRFIPKDSYIYVSKEVKGYVYSQITDKPSVVETYLSYLFESSDENFREKFRVAAKFSRIVKIRNPERIPANIQEIKNKYDAGVDFVIIELSEIKYTVRRGEVRDLSDTIKVRGYIITVDTTSHVNDVEKVREEHKNIPLWLVGTKIDRKSRRFRHVISYYFIPV